MKILTTIKLSVCSVLLALSLPLLAMDLAQAMNNLSSVKSQGLVGEQSDGYLGVVQASAEVSETVKLINEARRAQYQRLAKDNNLALPDVEAMAGVKAIEKTPSGQYVQANKKWIKKP